MNICLCVFLFQGSSPEIKLMMKIGRLGVKHKFCGINTGSPPEVRLVKRDAGPAGCRFLFFVLTSFTPSATFYSPCLKVYFFILGTQFQLLLPKPLDLCPPSLTA